MRALTVGSVGVIAVKDRAVGVDIVEVSPSLLYSISSPLKENSTSAEALVLVE